MTEEQLEELYQGIINADDYGKKITLLYDEYHNNNDLNAYEVIKRVVSTCKDKITGNSNDNSFYILNWCKSISKELDDEIRDFCLQYCENQEKNDNITKYYGVSAICLYRITGNLDWFKKYLSTFCIVQVFSNDDDTIVCRLKELRKNEFIKSVGILIDGFDSNRSNECEEVIKKLISNDYNVRILFDTLLSKGISVSSYLKTYLDYCRYSYEYEVIEYLLKNEDDDILKVLANYTWREYNLEYSNLLFLNSITKYLNDDIEFSQFINVLFKEYSKFRQSSSYSKLMKLNISNLNKLIARIEELIGYSDTDIVLDESDMPIFTNMLKNEIDNIYKKIVNMTSYGIAVDDLKDINIKYSYEEKKEYYDGVDIKEIIEQAKTVYGLVSNLCPICEVEHCRIGGWLKGLLDVFLDNPTYGNAKSILSHFEDCQYPCINKELRKEILKLKRLIMSLPYTMTIYGEYYNEDNTIILYLKNIYANNKNECGNKLLSTFAHELFHAYHAICVEVKGNTWKCSDSDSRIVIESLASYFENEYDYTLERAWLESTIDLWPYAGAKHLTPYGKSHGSIKYPDNVLFRYVFMESLKSISKACEMIRFGEKMEFEEF